MHHTMTQLAHDVTTPLSRRRALKALIACASTGLALPAFAQAKAAMPLSVWINRAGKMRALSQRASKAYVQSTLDVIPERAREILQSTQRIIAGNLEELLAASPPAEVRQALLLLEKDIASFTAALNGTPRREEISNVTRTADAMLLSADAATRAYQALSKQSGAKIVNIAGRQRMLSQRAARAYFLIAAGQDTPAVRKQLDDATAEFKTALGTLQNTSISTPAIRGELELARSQWMFYEAALAKKSSPDTLQTVATTSERILEVMDNLTSLYDSAVRDLIG